MSEDIDKLIKDLDDEHGFGRHYVAKALAQIRDARAVEALCRALGDGNEIPHIRLGAAKALGNIGDARAVEPLCEALGDVRNYLTHEYAAEALARIGDPRAVEPLCKVLGNKDID